MVSNLLEEPTAAIFGVVNDYATLKMYVLKPNYMASYPGFVKRACLFWIPQVNLTLITVALDFFVDSVFETTAFSLPRRKGHKS